MTDGFLEPGTDPGPDRVTDPDMVDDLVDLWHDGAGEGLELHEFLGWTWDEYGEWVRTNRPPRPLL